MRTPQHDRLIDPTSAARRGQHEPERRCVLTGEVRPADQLIRLAIGPDGTVAPDVLVRAPGRGAWLGVDRAALDAAQTKGKLKAALARTFKDGALVVPDDLGERIAAQLERATLDRLGLESRAGLLLTGMERIVAAARAGQVALLLHAQDAGSDGCASLAQAWRVGMDAEGSGQTGTRLPVDRTRLSAALGRENAVHLALTDARAAARVMGLLSRWQFFAGWVRDDASVRRTASGAAAAAD